MPPLIVLHQFLIFFENAQYSITFFTHRRLIQGFENFGQALDLPFAELLALHYAQPFLCWRRSFEALHIVWDH
jgi:hypothetical protein